MPHFKSLKRCIGRVRCPNTLSVLASLVQATVGQKGVGQVWVKLDPSDHDSILTLPRLQSLIIAAMAAEIFMSHELPHAFTRCPWALDNEKSNAGEILQASSSSSQEQASFHFADCHRPDEDVVRTSINHYIRILQAYGCEAVSQNILNQTTQVPGFDPEPFSGVTPVLEVHGH